MFVFNVFYSNVEINSIYIDMCGIKKFSNDKCGNGA